MFALAATLNESTPKVPIVPVVPVTSEVPELAINQEQEQKQKDEVALLSAAHEASLQTGDIILFRGTGFIPCLLEYFGRSRYSHVGIIVRNPKFINPGIEDGIYVLESIVSKEFDVEDNKLRNGVTLHHIDDVLKKYSKGSVYVRHVSCQRTEDFYKKFIKVHNQVHEKPYDLNLYDWLCAEYNIDCPFPEQDRFKHTNTFWCSALATYVLCEVGVVQNRVNWSLVAPRDFSCNEGKHLIFLCDLSDEILIY